MLSALINTFALAFAEALETIVVGVFECDVFLTPARLLPLLVFSESDPMTAKLVAAAVIAVAMMAAHVQAGVIVFQEDFEGSPIGTLQFAGATGTPQADPLSAGNTVAGIDISAANFVNFNTGIITLPANAVTAEFLADINVPTGAAGDMGDFFFNQIQFFSAADVLTFTPTLGNFNSGFPSLDPATATLDTLQTVSTTAIAIPAGAVAVRGLGIAGNGGATAGTAFFADNIILDVKVEVPAIPEPSSLALLGLCGLAAGLRRRR